jgi:hypothetical protein
MSIVNQIVDRLHVGDSDRAVVRYVRSRLTKKARRPAFRAERKKAYRMAIARHHRNQDLFLAVCRGTTFSGREIEITVD